MNKSNKETERDVPVTLLLVESQRNPDSVAKVQAIAAQLGMNVTSAGKASVCCTISRLLHKKIFGTEPTKVNERPIGKFDFGTPAGFEPDVAFQVPPEFQNLVESISVEPPATRMVGHSPDQ